RPYNKASFPLNIAAPLFRWDDEVNNLWLLNFDISSGKTIKVITHRKSWRPKKRLWNKMKKESIGKYIKITILGC
ncbi:unnamed protein product, partial [marine sediment metagenome]